MKQVMRRAMAQLIAGILPPSIMRDVRFFELFEKRGYHVTPVHFYQTIPSPGDISESHFSESSDLVGLTFDENEQLKQLDDFVTRYKAEFDQLEFPEGPLCYMDRFMLYCMVRRHKPARIVEIGSGLSTRVSSAAIQKNAAEGAQCRMSAIEPFPQQFLREGLPGLSELIEKPVQQVEPEYFEQLEANDILFIDSTHVVKTGSDVIYEFVELLPRLKPGVIVHVHDIFLPYSYPREWVIERRNYWTEQYLLQAFLAFNDSFDIKWMGQMVAKGHTEVVARAEAGSPEAPTSPGSVWMQRRV